MDIFFKSIFYLGLSLHFEKKYKLKTTTIAAEIQTKKRMCLGNVGKKTTPTKNTSIVPPSTGPVVASSASGLKVNHRGCVAFGLNNKRLDCYQNVTHTHLAWLSKTTKKPRRHSLCKDCKNKAKLLSAAAAVQRARRWEEPGETSGKPRRASPWGGKRPLEAEVVWRSADSCCGPPPAGSPQSCCVETVEVVNSPRGNSLGGRRAGNPYCWCCCSQWGTWKVFGRTPVDLTVTELRTWPPRPRSRVRLDDEKSEGSCAKCDDHNWTRGPAPPRSAPGSGSESGTRVRAAVTAAAPQMSRSTSRK